MSNDLASALEAFDRVAVTLDRLEKVWQELKDLTPAALEASPNAERYDELLLSFDALASGLPAVGAIRINPRPVSLSEFFQCRYDAHIASIPEALVDLRRAIAAPSEAIIAYKHTYLQRRRKLIRRRADELVGTPPTH